VLQAAPHAVAVEFLKKRETSAVAWKTCQQTLPRSGFVQLILWPAGHSIESTVRYLGVEVNDALDIAEKIEV
jgi:hypothetical protein